MTARERNRIVRAINRYVRAFDDYSWKGAGDPEDIPKIEMRLDRARAALQRALNEATVEAPSLMEARRVH